jgi:cell wall-associated NlpC family hydrolase
VSRYRPRYQVAYLRVPYRRYRYRARAARSPGTTAAVAVAGAALVLGAGHTVVSAAVHHPPAAHAAPHHSTHYETAAARKAIAYARDQLGRPYEWGGIGPNGYDCSGLVMMAWRAAGVDIPRTSESQWAGLRHISRSQVRPGDLVFFPGSDGTWSAPGHVALVISATQMIQAYSQGVPIEVSPLNGDGAGGIVGFARP